MTWLQEQSDWYHKVAEALKAHQGSLELFSFENMYYSFFQSLPSISSPINVEGVGRLLKTYAGPLAMLLGAEQLSSTDRLLILAHNLPSNIEHILLDVVHPWNPHLLLSPTTPLPPLGFPNLKRLYIRYHLLSGDNRPFGLVHL